MLYKSISEYLMPLCKCSKHHNNGYYVWKCVTLSCTDCKDLKPGQSTCSTSTEHTTCPDYKDLKPSQLICSTSKKHTTVH